MENNKTFTLKSGCRRLQEMVVNTRGFNYKDLTEQFFGILDWCWLIEPVAYHAVLVVVTH